ncbi:MAG: hypothetical protein RSC36_03055, partial [Ruthenibacterium sp.]
QQPRLLAYAQLDYGNNSAKAADGLAYGAPYVFAIALFHHVPKAPFFCRCRMRGICVKAQQNKMRAAAR